MKSFKLQVRGFDKNNNMIIAITVEPKERMKAVAMVCNYANVESFEIGRVIGDKYIPPKFDR